MQVTTLLKARESVHGISSDSLGHLYYCTEEAIWRVSLDNSTPQLIAGGNRRGFLDGDAKDAKVDPSGLCVDEKRDSVYFTQTHCVRVLKDGQVTTLVGTGERGYADGKGGQARFYGPFGIVVD